MYVIYGEKWNSRLSPLSKNRDPEKGLKDENYAEDLKDEG